MTLPYSWNSSNSVDGCVTNKKKLDMTTCGVLLLMYLFKQVTADKERMAMEVEREEEFLTNKLVKKLDQVK